MSTNNQQPTESSSHTIEFTLNGEDRTVTVPANRTLIGMLRDDLNHNGTTQGCGIGVCGSCTVLVDGSVVSSCLEFAVNVDGCEIRTVEGLDTEYPGSEMHPLQEAFQDNEGFQCGYCTPGILMGAAELLEKNPDPTREEIIEQISENLCRCTGYKSILDSIEEAAKAYDPE